MTPVEAQGDLRLIRVEMIAANTCHGLHVCVVLFQDFFIVLCSRRDVVHFLKDTSMFH